MPNKNLITLAEYRLEKARQCAVTAKNILFDGDYNASVDRSCFAIFHGMRATMILDGLDPREGSAVTAKFKEQYVLTGIFEERFSRIISKVFDLRTACDYDDFFVVSRQQAEQQEKNACVFLDRVGHYIADRKAC